MPLSDQQKARVRYHMGYPDTSVGLQVFAGSAWEYERTLLLDTAMEIVNETSVTRIQTLLQTLDRIDEQLGSVGDRRKAAKIGEITLNPKEQAELEELYAAHAHRLADVIGVSVNMRSERFGRRSVNVPVVF